ncbi:MAG: hypothetical protein DELT_03119 [Desulfovibrio sp.]
MAGGKVTPGGVAANADSAAHAAGKTIKVDGLSFKNEVEHATWMGNKDAVAHKLDAHGNIDIAGIKISFGSKSADGQWTTANDLFKHVSVDDLEKSVTRGRTDVEALHNWFTGHASNPPYPGAPAGDRLRTACSGTINGKTIVAGQDGKLAFEQGINGEKPFISRNQNAIAPDKREQRPTLINGEAVETGKARYGKRDKYPNDMVANAHAEIAFMQHAYESGLIKAGDSITLPVTGKAVCRNCQRHLPLMAQKTGVRFMTVIDRKEGIIYYWKPGMTDLEELGSLP